ncbi:MAG: cytochrome c oxidase assembly protein [Pseudomonadota bacterium]
MRITERYRQIGTVPKLCLLVVGMFGFAFALVPLYNLLCEITGLGGKTGGKYDYDPAAMAVDDTREIKVNFITNTNGGMPWQFGSAVSGMRVNPGKLNEAVFVVTNTTKRVMVGQAVPSVVPIRATDHFHKTECFCFEQQVLEPGETMEMPMRFIVGTELPGNIQSISLSYALFDITDSVSPSVIEAELAANKRLLRVARVEAPTPQVTQI